LIVEKMRRLLPSEATNTTARVAQPAP
jgi:hypothetical protein